MGRSVSTTGRCPPKLPLMICYLIFQNSKSSSGSTIHSTRMPYPVSSIVCQVARGVCSLTKPHLWATTTLQRVRTVFAIVSSHIDSFDLQHAISTVMLIDAEG